MSNNTDLHMEGLNAYMQDLFDNTSLTDRIRKNPDKDAMIRMRIAFERDLLTSRQDGYDAGVRDTVLDAIAALETLSYRAGRKSCVETLRKVFEVPDSEGVNTYE